MPFSTPTFSKVGSHAAVYIIYKCDPGKKSKNVKSLPNREHVILYILSYQRAPLGTVVVWSERPKDAKIDQK